MIKKSFLKARKVSHSSKKNDLFFLSHHFHQFSLKSTLLTCLTSFNTIPHQPELNSHFQHFHLPNKSQRKKSTTKQFFHFNRRKLLSMQNRNIRVITEGKLCKEIEKFTLKNQTLLCQKHEMQIYPALTRKRVRERHRERSKSTRSERNCFSNGEAQARVGGSFSRSVSQNFLDC